MAKVVVFRSGEVSDLHINRGGPRLRGVGATGQLILDRFDQFRVAQEFDLELENRASVRLSGARDQFLELFDRLRHRRAQGHSRRVSGISGCAAVIELDNLAEHDAGRGGLTFQPAWVHCAHGCTLRPVCRLPKSSGPG